MIDRVCHLKRLTERSWPMLSAHLRFVAAAFNILTSWAGTIELAIARYAL